MTVPHQPSRHRIHWYKAQLRHAALTRTAMWLSRGRAANSRSVTHVRIVEHAIRLPRLPEALHGLRIVQLSDLHIGDLLPPDRLPALVDKVNQLAGDLIAVTGDFVDLSLRVLDPVIEALGKLTAPLGVYHVMGNHDYIENGGRVIDQFRVAGLSLLMNESVHIVHNGCGVKVAGIDWARSPLALAQHVQSAAGAAGGDPGAPSKQAGSQRDGLNDDLRLLLAHNPNAFDAAVRHNFDLTLSGHTHGGQVILAQTRGKRGSIGLGALAHRYPHGLYRNGDRYLYVTSGIGSWFPLRVKCPAEIACLTLRQAPEHVPHAEGV